MLGGARTCRAKAFAFTPGNRRGFERYERREKIGRGAMGVVYKAVQSGLGRVVAIKVMLAGAYAEPEERQRFHHEARTVARLRHANIVQIHDFGDQEDEPFLVMEFVEGGNLAEKIAGQPQPPAGPRSWSRRWLGPCTTPTSKASFTAISSRPISCCRAKAPQRTTKHTKYTKRKAEENSPALLLCVPMRPLW